MERFSDIHISKIARGKKTYLHLELYEHYRSGHGETIINGFKENTFALGLIILEIAFNIDMEDLYQDRFHLLKSKTLTKDRKQIKREQDIEFDPPPFVFNNSGLIFEPQTKSLKTPSSQQFFETDQFKTKNASESLSRTQ